MTSYLSRFLVCLPLSITLLLGTLTRAQTNSTTQQPLPGVSEGQKIGTIIKTAITTAAPAIPSILDTLFGFLNKPKPTDKATKEELQTAANNNQKTLNSKTVAGTQKAIQPIQQVSDELEQIARFLEPSTTATQFLIVMKTKTTGTPPDWKTIENAWEVANKQINQLKSVSDSDLNKIRDLYLRDKFRQMRNANDLTVIIVNQEVTQKNLDGLKSDLPTLLGILANSTAMAGYEINELQAEIADLALWAKGGQGSSASVPKRELYINFLDANLTSNPH